MNIETTILKHLVHDEQFTRKVIPFLRAEYFEGPGDKFVFNLISTFVTKYNSCPTVEALTIELNNSKAMEIVHNKSLELLEKLKKKPDKVAEQWLIDETEAFCKKRALYNAIVESAGAIDGSGKLAVDGIPDLLREALSVSFDTNVGHDFLEDFEERYDFYHATEEKIPFDLDFFNKITRGGFSKKSLNIFLAGTGVGKTLLMCHCAAQNLLAGKNVLYITMEMAEEKIAQRIDANLLNVVLDDLEVLPKDIYEKKVSKLRARTLGKLIIKEFPTASAHVGHIRHLLNELYLKKEFVPDIIYIDYINICTSARFKMGANVNSYSYIKSIAEELRGLAVEKNVPIVSATQTNREGYASSDVDLTNTSESFGLPATADFMMAIITNEELESLNQFLCKQLKNRYADLSFHRRFVIGVDKPRMKLYDTEQSSQEDIHDGPVMDSTAYGSRQNEEDQMGWATKKMGRKDFSGLKV